MSRVAAALAIALTVTWSMDGIGVRPAAAQFPPGPLPGMNVVTAADDSPATEPPFQTVRPAAVSRGLAEAGYFRPLLKSRKTQAALERAVAFDYQDQPLEAFFADLALATGVPVFLDRTGLEEAAITSDAEITCRSAGMPLRVALDLLLRDLDCAYLVEDEYLLITSRESAELSMETQMYALVDHPLLRGCEPDRLAEAIRRHATVDRWSGDYPCTASVIPGAVAITAEPDHQKRAQRLLRQYGRLLAEYDALSPPPRGVAQPGERAHCVTVRRTPVARDPASFFRPIVETRKTLAVLRKPSSIDVEDKSLEPFFAGLESQVGVPFRVDATGLEEAGVPWTTELTFRSQGVSYEAALELLLRDYDLIAVPQEKDVLVTSRGESYSTRATGVYAIAGHPLLRSATSDGFLQTLRQHIAVPHVVYPEGYGVSIRQGILRIAADREMLRQAESFLGKYRLLLAEYDLAQGSALPSLGTYAAASPRGASDPSATFRPLYDQPRTLLALQRPAEIDVEDVPLEVIFADLERTLGVQFDLDETGLEEAALTSDAEVTFRGSGASYATVLSQMLDGLDLALVATDDYVSITSRDMADILMETRAYAIVDSGRLPSADAKDLIPALKRHMASAGVDDPESYHVSLLPGALVVTAGRETLAKAEEHLRRFGLAPAEFAPVASASKEPPLLVCRPPFPKAPPVSPNADPFGKPSGADPFGKPAAEPFANPPADSFAPSADSGR